MGRATTTMPGTRWKVRTTLLEIPAWCDLHFAVDDRLSKMSCALDPRADSTSHIAAEHALVQVFTERYGAPDSTAQEHEYSTSRERRFSWEDQDATLVVESRFDDHASVAGLYETLGSPLPVESTVEVHNTSAEHDDLAERLLDEAEAERQRAQRIQDARDAEQQQREVERLLQQLEAGAPDL